VPVLPGAAPIRERGCGDAVSLTPPYAVTTAAAAAARIAVAHLTGAGTDASHVEVLAIQPDAPYQQLGLGRPDAPAHAVVASPTAAPLAEQDRRVVRLDPHDPVGSSHILRTRPPAAPANSNGAAST
jgi:hypothetical protein